MTDAISDQDLLAYADEALEIDLATHIEGLLRENSTIRNRLQSLLETRDQGNIGIGDIWRHERLSCPKRSELGLYLIHALEPDLHNYLRFHLEDVHCVYCHAILEEMKVTATDESVEEKAQKRREQLFASSAGLLRPLNETE